MIISPELNNKLNDVVSTSVAAFIEKIPKIVDKLLSDSILNFLGVTCRFGSVEINSDRHKNPILSLVMSHIDNHLNECLTPLITQAIVKASNDQKFIENFQDSVRRHFENRAKDTLTNFKKMIDTAMDDVVNRIVSKITLNPINTDISNPASYQGPLGELLLEESSKLIAQRLSQKSTAITETCDE